MAMSPRKKATAKKPTTTKRAAAAKTTARKPAKKTTGKKRATASKGPARRLTPAEELAKRLLAGMDDERTIDLGKFYTEDAVSTEPAGGTYTGLQSLRSKLAGWLAGLRSSHWKPRHVLVSSKAIMIEWDADVTFKDGRQVKFSEVAVHELRGDKICSERYYYDPRALMAPAEPARPAKPPTPRPAPPPASSEGGSPIDPMDL